MSTISIQSGAGMPSRFQIDDIAYFQANVDLIVNGKTDPAKAVKCRITGVGFTRWKVHYDLELLYEYPDRGVTEYLPLQGVPSDLIAESI